MKAPLRLFFIAAIAICFAPNALAAHTHVPTPSAWALDVPASDFGAGPSFTSDVWVVTTDTEKWFKYSDVTVASDGTTYKTSWEGPQDGTQKPLAGSGGGTLSFKTAEDSFHMVEADGTVIDGIFVLSPDKKTVTFNQTGSTRDGKSYKQTLVYHRTK